MLNIKNIILILLLCICHSFTASASKIDTCAPLPASPSTDLKTKSTYGFLKDNIFLEDPGSCYKSLGNKFKFYIKSKVDDEYVEAEIDVNKTKLLSDWKNTEFSEFNWLDKTYLSVKHYPNEQVICLVTPTIEGVMPIACRKYQSGYNAYASHTIIDICKNIGDSCNVSNSSISKSKLGLFGPLVKCFTESLDKMFFIGSVCDSDDLESSSFSSLRPFPQFHQLMRGIILAALTLYVIFYGFNILTNPQALSLNEMAMFVFKMIFVIYFAIGFNSSWGFDSSYTESESSSNGMTELVLPLLSKMLPEFVEMFVNHTGSGTLCNYLDMEYPAGYESYKLWDNIDCRLAEYLGLEKLGSDLFIGIAALGVGFLFAGNVMIFALLLVYIIFIISYFIYCFSSYIMCLLFLYIMVFISPIFIPMILFERTKDYFFNWLKILISTVLQPAIIITSLVMLFGIFDHVMYGPCEFKYNQAEKVFNVIDIENDSACRNTAGGKLLKMYSDGNKDDIHFLFFTLPFRPDQYDIAGDLMFLVLYLALFYFFLQTLSQLSADLTSGPNLQATSVFTKYLSKPKDDDNSSEKEGKKGDNRATDKSSSKGAKGGGGGEGTAKGGAAKGGAAKAGAAKGIGKIAGVLLAILAFLVIVGSIMMTFLMAIAPSLIPSLCIERYNIDDNQQYQLTTISRTQPITLDAKTAEWQSAGINVNQKDELSFEIKGDVSLCESYISDNNLQQDSEEGSNGKKIRVPRVYEDATPVNIIFDATRSGWKNLMEIRNNDHIMVGLYPDQKDNSNARMYDSFKGSPRTANCLDGYDKYSPLCGRYSIWGASTSYTTQCEQKTDRVKKLGDCKHSLFNYKVDSYWCENGLATQTYYHEYETYYTQHTSTSPMPYLSDGTHTLSRDDLLPRFAIDCNNSADRALIGTDEYKKFWFSADDAAGLFYNLPNGSSRKANILTIGDLESSDPEYKKLTSAHDAYKALNPAYNIIYHDIYHGEKSGQLQYKMNGDKATESENTGGYVLNIKHTKCRRVNGQSINGTGSVNYIISKDGTPPSDSDIGRSLQPNSNGNAFLSNSNSSGSLWLRIHNKQKQYDNSEGVYNLNITLTPPPQTPFVQFLDDILNTVKNMTKSVSKKILQGVTCYGKDNDDCTSFFRYLNFMMVSYIVITAMLFLLGMVKMNQMELITRLAKVAVVAGLINEQTVSFFNDYLFDFITEFAYQMIAKMSSNSANSPFFFLDEFMSKLFVSNLIWIQVPALLFSNIFGVVYVIMIGVVIVVVVISLLRAVASYLIAYVALALLISVAPLFFSFMLFAQTRPLFDNWIKITFKYMMEPILVFTGMIFFTQLFTMYLDEVLNFSVCFKCAFPIGLDLIPSVELPALLDLPLFCIYWFSPFGMGFYDQVNVAFFNILALIMLAHIMYEYHGVVEQISTKISGYDGPSTVKEGVNAVSPLSNKVDAYLMNKASAGKEMISSSPQKAKQVLKKLGSSSPQKAKQALINKVSAVKQKAHTKLKNARSKLANIIKIKK